MSREVYPAALGVPEWGSPATGTQVEAVINAQRMANSVCRFLKSLSSCIAVLYLSWICIDKSLMSLQTHRPWQAIWMGKWLRILWLLGICHEPTRPTYPTCIVAQPHAWFASGERNQSRTFVPVHPTFFRISLLEALIRLGNSCRLFSTGIEALSWSARKPLKLCYVLFTNRLQGI